MEKFYFAVLTNNVPYNNSQIFFYAEKTLNHQVF